MKRNGFTLIELLVVVAIIGILAAVGVVAYNGYTSGAKKSSIKSNFKTVSKYISAEIMKCQIGHDTIFLNSGSYKVGCGGIDNAYKMTGAIPWDSQLKKIFNPFDKDKSIMENDNYPSKPISDNDIGLILYSFPSWPGRLRSCFAIPCSKSENILITELNYQ